MTPQQSLQSLFHAALERPDAGERDRFLDEACGADGALRERVASLLRAREELGAFMAQPSRMPAGLPLDHAGQASGPLLEKPGDKIGRYRLLHQIGEGGCGVVYLAEQEEPVRRQVALKVIRPGMDTRQVVARFEAERQALGMMDHPNIARVFDGGATEAGRPYFVMEWVQGVRITEYCDQNGLPARERLGLFIQVCQAVQHAHQKGIIHRDIKPSNILVTVIDGVPVPKVIDFGIAKATEQKLTELTMFTEFQQFVGTPAYTSPEQAGVTHLDVDTRSDIYSLGVLLYELLTGKAPFDSAALVSRGVDEMRRIIRETEPPRPSARLRTLDSPEISTIAARRHTPPTQLLQSVQGDLDWIIMKCLEKDRDRRYDTATGLAADLQRHLGNEPVTARPPSRWYVLRKAVRRHKRAVAAAGAVAAALAAGLGLSSWLYLRERAARQGEAEQRKLAERAAEAAVQQEQVAAAVADFLQHDLLRQADPTVQADSGQEGAAGFAAKADPTVRELLDRAVLGLAPGRIERRFPGQRHVQSMVLKTIGETYSAIGRYPEAIECLERADQLDEAAHGQDPRVRLAHSPILANLGVAYTKAGRLPEAAGLLERIREAISVVKGADHPDTLLVLNNLASVHSAAGKVPEAIALLEQVSESMRRTLGPEHVARARTLVNLAWAYGQNGQVADQIKLLEEARDVFVRRGGPDHPDTVNALHNLASAFMDADRLPEATRLMEEILEKQTKLRGADHPDTLTGLNNLALAYQKAGQIPRSIEILEQARATAIEKPGPRHPLTILILGNLGQGHQAAGNGPAALPFYEQAAEGIASHGFRLEMADRTLANFVALLRALGRTDDAMAWEDRWLAAVKARDGEESGAYSSMLFDIGLSRLEREAWREAEPPLRACLALFEKLQPDDWTTFATRFLVGVSLMNQKLNEEAEVHLVQGYEGMQAREEKIPPEGKWRLPQAIEDIARFYETTDRPQKAAEWRARLP